MSADQTRAALMRPVIRRWAAVGLGVVLACALAGVVVASRIDDGSDLAAAIEQDQLVRVADIPAAEGSTGKGVYVQRTRTGHLCVWEAPSATSRQRGGGCNTADDPLNGRPLSFTLSYDGGPAAADVKRASLFGLVESDVARASVLMSDGTQREIRIQRAEVPGTEFRAFGFRFKKGDLREGITPIAVVAIDANGAELDRQQTGIGS
jgi:hypothetical protein